MATNWITESNTIAVERVRLHSIIVTGGSSAYGTLKLLDGRDDDAEVALVVITAPNATQQFDFRLPAVFENGLRVTLDGNLAGAMVVFDYA